MTVNSIAALAFALMPALLIAQPPKPPDSSAPASTSEDWSRLNKLSWRHKLKVELFRGGGPVAGRYDSHDPTSLRISAAGGLQTIPKERIRKITAPSHRGLLIGTAAGLFAASMTLLADSIKHRNDPPFERLFGEQTSFGHNAPLFFGPLGAGMVAGLVIDLSKKPVYEAQRDASIESRR